MLNLRTKGLNNAAAVLGGYDALVRAGFPVETGNGKTSTAPAEKKIVAAPAPNSTQTNQPTEKSSPPASTPAKQTKRQGRKTKH